MNQANVDALAAAIGGAFSKVENAALSPSLCLELAEAMIEDKAVLVPSVLTVQEVGNLYDVPEREEFRQSRIEDLEWAARGQD